MYNEINQAKVVDETGKIEREAVDGQRAWCDDMRSRGRCGDGIVVAHILGPRLLRRARACHVAVQAGLSRVG